MSLDRDPLRSSQRYWRHRDGNRRVRRGRFIRRAGQLSMLLGLHTLIGITLLVGVLKLMDNLTSGPQFALQEVEWSGNQRVTKASLESHLKPYLGSNILDLNLDQVSQQLAKEAWVQRVQVRRQLPSTLLLNIEERVPAAIADIRGIFHLVDQEGIVLGPLHSAPVDDLPLLLGLPNEDKPLVEALARGVRWLEALQTHHGAFYHELSELDLSQPDRVIARLRMGGPELYLDPEQITRNLTRFQNLRPRLRRQHGDARYVDLRWQDRITVKPALSS